MSIRPVGLVIIVIRCAFFRPRLVDPDQGHSVPLNLLIPISLKVYKLERRFDLTGKSWSNLVKPDKVFCHFPPRWDLTVIIIIYINPAEFLSLAFIY